MIRKIFLLFLILLKTESLICQKIQKEEKLFFEIGTALHMPLLSLGSDWIYSINTNQYPIADIEKNSRRLDLNLGLSYMLSKQRIELSNYFRVGYTYILGNSDTLFYSIFPEFNKKNIVVDNTLSLSKYLLTNKNKDKFFYTGFSFSWHNINRTYLATPNKNLPVSNWTFVLRSLQYNSVGAQFGLEVGKKKSLLDNTYLEFRTEYVYNLNDGGRNRDFNFLRFGLRFYKKLEISFKK